MKKNYFLFAVCTFFLTCTSLTSYAQNWCDCAVLRCINFGSGYIHPPATNVTSVSSCPIRICVNQEVQCVGQEPCPLDPNIGPSGPCHTFPPDNQICYYEMGAWVNQDNPCETHACQVVTTSVTFERLDGSGHVLDNFTLDNTTVPTADDFINYLKTPPTGSGPHLGTFHKDCNGNNVNQDIYLWEDGGILNAIWLQ